MGENRVQNTNSEKLTGPDEPVEQVCVVDENDQILGVKERRALDYANDRWRVVVVLVVNTERTKTLMAKRSMNVQHAPGKWGTCVGGTVGAGETYEETAVRETWEELGLTVTEDDLDLVFYGVSDDRGSHRYVCVYIYEADLDAGVLNWCDSEIDTLAWVDVHELQTDLQQNEDKYDHGAKTTFQVLWR